MGTGSVVTNNGRLIAMNRAFKATPDYTAPTLFSVGVGTTTPTVTDTALGSIVAIDGGNTKAFEGGYPSFDETNMQATIKCLLDNAEANGNNISEFGLFNTDGTPKMFSHGVFTAIAKTVAIKIAIYEKDKVSVG